MSPPSRTVEHCEEWMTGLTLALSWKQFHALPRHPSFRYEYLSGKAYISPRPRYFHALLDLDPPAFEGADVVCEPLDEAAWAALPPLFAGAFARVQPFAGLDEPTRLDAARQALERARRGGDGPWIDAASFVARQEGELAGALLVTLLPDTDPSRHDAYHWPEPPPADAVARRLGRPHLTWVFVSPERARHGVASALLAASARALLALGYTQLASTFLAGNDASLLWHWRRGFRLLPHPRSRPASSCYG